MDIYLKISNKQENIDFYFINSIYDTIKGEGQWFLHTLKVVVYIRIAHHVRYILLGKWYLRLMNLRGLKVSTH